MVPIAPSRMSTRSFTSLWRWAMRSSRVLGWDMGLILQQGNQFLCLNRFRRDGRGLRTQAKHMADRKGEISLVQRVEVKAFKTIAAQAVHLLRRHIGRDQLACAEIVIKPDIIFIEPSRHRGAA